MSRSAGGAILVLKVANRKLAPQVSEPTNSGRPRPLPVEPFCAATTTSIAATCPLTCPWMRAGCYEQAGTQQRRQYLLDRAASSGLDVIRAEARLIESSVVPTGRPLRLHVGGDVSCTEGAQLLGAAVRGWLNRGGGPAWTYSHRWREIRGRAWESIVAFASIEHPREGRAAILAGYRPALVVQEFPAGDRAFLAGGVTYVPCPYETRGVSCTQCRLCLGNLPAGKGVAFRVHGGGAAKASDRIGRRDPHRGDSSA